jgi:hypothetical protein
MQRSQPETQDFHNDPVSKQVKWTPIGPNNANFKTHKLVKLGGGVYRFKPTFGYMVFSFIFFLAGLGVLTALVLNFSDFVRQVMPAIAMGVVGSIFTLLGAFLVYSSRKIIEFDFRRSTITIGKEQHYLYEIHALQILEEYSKSDKSSYYSYELNLVFKDGKRVNVVDHGAYEELVQDASQLGMRMGIPVWDGTNYYQDDEFSEAS